MPESLQKYAAAITQSLDVVSEHGDPAPAVYDLLFARNPEMKQLFWRDSDGGIRGNMLAMTIEVLLDFVATHHFSDGMLRCEIVNHEGLGVPQDVFATFFPTMRDAFREIAGEEWTDEMETAWNAVLEQIFEVMRAAAPAL